VASKRTFSIGVHEPECLGESNISKKVKQTDKRQRTWLQKRIIEISGQVLSSLIASILAAPKDVFCTEPLLGVSAVLHGREMYNVSGI
jgi:hypothetical protein